MAQSLHEFIRHLESLTEDVSPNTAILFTDGREVSAFVGEDANVYVEPVNE